MIISTKNLSGLAKVSPFAFSKILSFAVLITVMLFAENAVAACNIKLHVREPAGTNSWNAFFVVFGTGTSETSPATADRRASGATADAATGAGWFVADLNTLNPGTLDQGFLILRTNNGNSKIGRDYNVTAATNFLACPTGANGGDYYLYEDPANPGRSLLSTTPPSSDPGPGGSSSSSTPGGGSSSSNATARTFYFLPPNDPEWISSTPYFWLRSNPTPLKMSIDPDRCGWYKIEFSASSIPSGDAFVLRTQDDSKPNIISTYRIGLLGMTEDPSDWECNSQKSCFPTPFDLSKQFSEISSPAGSRNLFFVADAGEWHATDPGVNERERCSYNFAAIIYDTDRSVNCSFNPNNGTATWNATGFKKGIVQPTLDANRKLQFNGSAATERCSRTNESSNASCVFSSATAAPSNCIGGWSAANFNKAWDAKDPSNVVRCYDMPFERSKAGLWEFNSNQLCRNGNAMDLNGSCNGYGGYLGGFFPNELQTRGDADYSGCPDCDTKYNATGWQGLANGVNSWCYERGWRGTGRNTGDLSGLATTAEINAAMTGAGCTEELNGTVTNLYSNTTNGSPGQRNFFFCFESHANFTYEPGQEFFFSGDDDVWIFINNRLVLDLGGVHSAVPGYVKLDTIKTPARLESGKEYPIDIFFCERNLNQSNIRITTNMYFSQQSGMFLKTGDAEIVGDVCLMRSGTGNSCAEMATGGNKLDTICGTKDALMKDLRYYIANRAGTAGNSLPTSWSVPGDPKGIVLDESSEFCEAKTDNVGPYLLCYGGIKIYRELGKVQVLDDEVVGLVGTWRVWAAYVGTISPKPPPMRVAEFTKNAKVRVVWGKLVHSVDNSSVGNLPNAKSDITVAGKPVKVGFAVATETSTNTFVVAMEEGGSPNQRFSLAGSSFGGVSIDDSRALSRSNLRVFADANGSPGEELSKDMVFTIPEKGYLELWFTGNFEAEDDASYTISASGTTASTYVLDVYQPRLRFVKQATTAATANAAAILGRTVGSKFDEGSPNQRLSEMIAWTGEQMERTLVAFDPTPSINNPSRWVPCGTYCKFPLRRKAQTYADASVSLADEKLINFMSGMSVEEGIAKFNFVGMAEVKDDDYAYFNIYGPSDLGDASARWDSLQFVEPPVPTPAHVEIHDRLGGGRGDSLVIIYNKSFRNKETDVMDILPNYIEIFWDEQRTDTIGYGLGVQGKADGKYYFNGKSKDNIDYWQQQDCDDPKLEGPCMLDDSTIVIVRDYDDSFSGERIKTAGKGKVVSWETFDDPDRNFAPTTIDFSMNIIDRIPPVVISALYKGDERNCGTSSSPCVDQVTVEISEPIKLKGEVSAEASKTAFAYILKSFYESPHNVEPGVFEVYDSQNSLPSIMRWRSSGTTGPATSGDSTVYLTFRAYRSDDRSNTAYTPSAGDSVRFLATDADSSGHPFTDTLGNSPHPLEWGVLIEGRNRSKDYPIRIAGIDLNNPDRLKDALKGLLDPEYEFEVDLNFFTPDRPIELIPVLDEWSDDNVKENYPGSVGVVYKPDVVGAVIDFESKHSVKVKEDNISFHAKSYYHTNLGNYVVKHELTGDNSLKCGSNIFRINGAKDCKTGASGGNINTGVYLAWNLKSAPVKKGPLNKGSDEGRYVGAGAYVQVYDIWWEINMGKDGPSETFDKVSKIEMFGVKRCNISSQKNEEKCDNPKRKSR